MARFRLHGPLVCQACAESLERGQPAPGAVPAAPVPNVAPAATAPAPGHRSVDRAEPTPAALGGDAQGHSQDQVEAAAPPAETTAPAETAAAPPTASYTHTPLAPALPEYLQPDTEYTQPDVAALPVLARREVEIGAELGRGSFGVVYKATAVVAGESLQVHS